MARRRRRTCLLCGRRSARLIRTNYVHATKEAVFCTLRCAAHWALIHMGMDLNGQVWCDEHGWSYPLDDGRCYQCPAEGGYTEGEMT